MSRSVLLVEDDIAIAKTILYALETEGFETLHVVTGQEALEHARSGGFVIMILDVGLPDQTGFDVLRKLRVYSPMPVLFLTARSDEIDRIVGLELGADDYMVKPFSPRELTARVRAILRRAEQQPLRSAHVPFSIDTNRRVITYEGKSLDLSRSEFVILAALIENPGHVFTRERLGDLLSDEPSMTLERTIDTHIKNLRAKLRAVRPDVDPIVTHRGVGYALREA